MDEDAHIGSRTQALTQTARPWSRSTRVPSSPIFWRPPHHRHRGDTVPAGRPSSYRPEYVDQAYSLCLLGATDEDLARAFNVAISTVSKWKEEHVEFSDALKAGKDEADAKVAQSLYRRAIGYEHKAVKIAVDAKTGAEHQVEYVERYPPDTVACIFWLKNRQRGKWRDRQDHEVTGPDGGPIQISAEERHIRAQWLLEQSRRRLEPQTIDVTPDSE